MKNEKNKTKQKQIRIAWLLQETHAVWDLNSHSTRLLCTLEYFFLNEIKYG